MAPVWRRRKPSSHDMQRWPALDTSSFFSLQSPRRKRLIARNANRDNAKQEGGAMIRRHLLLLVLVGLMPSLALAGGLTATEKKKIESDATGAFDMMFGLWKAGKYEDLYEYGSRKSHTSISKE